MRLLHSPINLSLCDCSLRFVALLILCLSAIRSTMRLFSSESNLLRLLFSYVSYGEDLFRRRARFVAFRFRRLVRATCALYNLTMREPRLSCMPRSFAVIMLLSLRGVRGGANDIYKKKREGKTKSKRQIPSPATFLEIFGRCTVPNLPGLGIATASCQK